MVFYIRVILFTSKEIPGNIVPSNRHTREDTGVKYYLNIGGNPSYRDSVPVGEDRQCLKE